MKRIKLLILFVFTLLLTFTLTSCKDEPYDEINSYTVTIDTNKDGTLNIRYDVKWDVLVSGSEDYILFGIPNENAKLLSYSGDVCNAYVVKDDGDFVRLELRDSFKASQHLSFSFTINQARMYQIKSDNGEEFVNYSFTPGWFDDIEIKSLVVKWNKDGVLGYGNKAHILGNYIVWEKTDLKKGETIECSLYYSINYFDNIDRSMQKEDDSFIGFIIFVIILVIVITILVLVRLGYIYEGSGYYSYRGFYVRRRFGHRHVNRNGEVIQNPSKVYSGGSGGSRGSGCACACACACAGGGRAGCSRKDFYNKGKNVDRILDELSGEINE